MVTPPPINTKATTITTSLPEITPFIALQLRVARLEQEMSEVKKTDHSADSPQKLRSEKSPKEIIIIKREQGEKQQDSTYSIRSTDKVALEEFDLKSALFKHMNKNKTANRNPANYHLYHALMEALIADEDAMDKEILNKMNSRAKVQSPKIKNNNPVEPKNHTHKPGRQNGIGQRFSLNKSSAVHEKPHTPRSCLRWKPTGRIFKTVRLRWIPTGKVFIDSTTKVDSEPPNGSNDDITNPYECNQTLYVSAGTSNSSAGTSVNPLKERLGGIHCISKFPSIYIQLFWNTLTHDAKTGRSLLHDNIVPKPDLALELGKSISLTEAEEEAVAREVHATHARIVSESEPEPTQRRQSGIAFRDSFIMSKKRSSDSSKKLKGIQTLTPAEQEAADIMKALKESKKMSKRQPGTGGSNEGTGSKPGVPDEEKLIL
ncbi:hypothetical protein Tco_0298883 [Tanacetum coccineum]